MPDTSPATQGHAVETALKGDRSTDIDRWNKFSKAEACKLATDPERSEPAAQPAGGPACSTMQPGGKPAKDATDKASPK
jgi:hypothetical protein